MTIVDTKFTDIDFNFINHPITGDIVKKKDENSVVQSIKTLILTRFYERKFHPEIGCQIHGQLFEMISDITADSIGDSIRNVLNNFEPRADILTLDVTPDDSNNGYTVFLEVKMINILNPVQVSFFLTRTR